MGEPNWSYTCAKCGHTVERQLTKWVLAFEVHQRNTLQCDRCGSMTWRGGGFSLSDIDAELLDAWIADTNLAFLDQDEELIVAGAPLAVLTTGFEKACTGRRDQLAIAIAIKLHDRHFADAREKEACADWLRAHSAEWIKSFGYDYVAKRVARELELA